MALSLKKNLRLLLALILTMLFFYSIQRVVFLVWNFSAFSNSPPHKILLAFFWGLRFDLYAVLALSIPSIILMAIPVPYKNSRPYILFQILLFMTIQTPAYILNQIDSEFFNFSGRRFTLHNLSILGEAQNKVTSYFLTHSGLILIQFLVLIALLLTASYVYFKVQRIQSIQAKSLTLLSVILIFPLATLGIRGGLQRKPLSMAHTLMFPSSHLNNLMINSTFTVLRGQTNGALKKVSYFSDKKNLHSLLNGYPKEKSLFTDNLSKKKTNVVIIILESFALEYMGLPNKTNGFTPFLDELSQKGLFFSNAYANARRSIEAIPSILSGIPTLMADAYVSSPYIENSLYGVGSYFKQIGYSTHFFHGGLPGTMYFDFYAKKAGFDKYYSSEDFPDSSKFDGYWGIWDEDFFLYTGDVLSKMETPFLATLFSLTSHHPYQVPDIYKDRLPSGEIPILKTIAYTDYSLRQFFEKIKEEPWFHNTLFVITADHTQTPYLQEFKNPLGRYRIPLLLYSPKVHFPKIDSDMVAQQIDILPTLLDMFKIPGKRHFFGKSLFQKGERYALMLEDQTFYYRDSQNCLKQVGLNSPLPFDCQILKNRAPATSKKDLELAKKRIQATLQYFNNGLIEDSIYE